VSNGKIPEEHVQELAGCFAACAPGLFRYACVLTGGDSALAGDVVHLTFVATAWQWPTVRSLGEAERLAWLRAAADEEGALVMKSAGDDAARPGGDEPAVVVRLPPAGRQDPPAAAAYEAGPGLARFAAWLREQPGDGAVASAIKASADTIPVPFWPIRANPDSDVDRAVTELYAAHYRALVRLAVLLVRDTPTAEEVVQDAIVAMHEGWHRLRDKEKALAYLRQAVVNRSRSILRHRLVADRNLQEAPPDMPSAEQGALVLLDRSAVVAALRDLPERQREAIVLRYYADLSEAQIAATMEISRGAVKSHTSRGMASLRTVLQESAEHPERT
jgi:RNA polymerase sigma-70 factor (sigma-E family)